ncbi:MAG TPA: hypothetical protein VF463_10865 [Sphingobium sp.]
MASLADVPTSVTDLQDWIAGRTPPPRHGEGLSDTLSVAALFHFALSATEATVDPLLRATLAVSRNVLDDRDEAGLWAPHDLVRFGPEWREAGTLLTAPYPASDLLCVAKRLMSWQHKPHVPS